MLIKRDERPETIRTHQRAMRRKQKDKMQGHSTLHEVLTKHQNTDSQWHHQVAETLRRHFRLWASWEPNQVAEHTIELLGSEQTNTPIRSAEKLLEAANLHALHNQGAPPATPDTVEPSDRNENNHDQDDDAESWTEAVHAGGLRKELAEAIGEFERQAYDRELLEGQARVEAGKCLQAHFARLAELDDHELHSQLGPETWAQPICETLDLLNALQIAEARAAASVKKPQKTARTTTATDDDSHRRDARTTEDSDDGNDKTDPEEPAAIPPAEDKAALAGKAGTTGTSTAQEQ